MKNVYSLSSFAKAILALSLLALALGFVDSVVNEQATGQIVLQENIKLESQEAGARIWKDMHWERELDLDAEPPILFYPNNVQLDDEGNVYLIDVMDYAIKKFNPEGALVQVFGLGKGQGPGEFLSVSDFFISSDGSLWATDVVNSRITVFDPEGQVGKIVRTDKRPLRIIQYPDNRYVAMMLAPHDGLFELYSAEGAEVGTFGQLIQDQVKNAIVLEGAMVNGSPESSVFVAWHAGVIASFSLEGDLNYLVETIDPLPWPDIDVARDGIRRPERRGTFASYSASVSDGKIYSLTQEDRDINIAQIVDVYEEATGKYIHSLRLPINCREAYWSDGVVHTISDNTVTRWRTEEAPLQGRKIALKD